MHFRHGAARIRIRRMTEDTLPELDFGASGTVDSALSERVRGLVGSEILKIASEIRELKATGRSICNLTVGDFDPRHFPLPPALAAGIRLAYEAGETNYPPPDGVLALRDAVVEYTARAWGPRYPRSSVLIASGARPILYAAYRSVLDPGDAVIYPVPSWNNNHYTWLNNAEGIVVPTRAEDGFMPTLGDLRPHLGRARMLVINSPLNPAGTVIGESALRSIVEAVVEENRRRLHEGRPALFLLHDQVYATLIFGAARHHMPVSLVPEAAPWIIELDGISKSLAATGLRIGWLLASPELTARMKDLIGHMGAWAPKPEQVALARFLLDAQAVDEFHREMNARVAARLDTLWRGFERMRLDGYPVQCIRPQGAIYLSLRLGLIGTTLAGRELATNEEIRTLLLDEAGLAMVPFQAFGLAEDTGWFRLSVGAVTLEDIEAAFPRLRRLLDGLG